MTKETTPEEQRLLWERKAGLNIVYDDYHRRIAAHCLPGVTLEVGAGSGHFKAIMPQSIALDIQPSPWCDIIADAHHLPFDDGSVANVTMLDVFHHFAQPTVFLAEALRVLRPGGRLVMIEPAMSPVNRAISSRMHHEGLDMSVDPFSPGIKTGPRPEDANLALPHLTFVTHRDRLAQAVPGLRVVKTEFFSLWAYPLSGGFQSWSLLPGALARPLLALESLAAPLLGRLAGFRLLVVAEKAG